MKNAPYIMITPDKLKFLLTTEEFVKVGAAIEQGKKAIFIQNAIIPLSIAPLVLPYDQWAAMENERLINSGKRLCKKCGSVMSIEEGCVCWERNGGKAKNPYTQGVLPENVKVMLKQVSDKKSFPKLLPEEKESLQIQKESDYWTD